MFYVTKMGVQVLGVSLKAPGEPGANWWAHHSACAWMASWLTLRPRRFLGEREVMERPEWSGRLDWVDRHSQKRSGHRPDMIGWTPSNHVFAVEVELASKSKARLNAILGLHRAWVDSGKIAAPFYVCGDEAGARRIEQAAKRAGIPVGSHTRLELLDTIKHQTVEAFEQQRATQDQDRQARSPLNRERSRAPVVGRPKLRLIE